MANALDNVMRDAEVAAASYILPINTQVPATANQITPVPSNDNTPPATAADMLANGGLLVDEYIQARPDGLKISGNMKGLLDTIDVEIHMPDVTAITQVRCTHAGQSTFLKSYDGVRSATGGNFQVEIAKARSTHEQVTGPYTTVEIPCTLLEDVKDPKSSLIFYDGCDLGHTPPMTGYKEYLKFLKTLSRKDPALLRQTLTVRLHHEARTNAKSNEWGVIRFELLDAV